MPWEKSSSNLKEICAKEVRDFLQKSMGNKKYTPMIWEYLIRLEEKEKTSLSKANIILFKGRGNIVEENLKGKESWKEMRLI